MKKNVLMIVCLLLAVGMLAGCGAASEPSPAPEAEETAAEQPAPAPEATEEPAAEPEATEEPAAEPEATEETKEEPAAGEEETAEEPRGYDGVWAEEIAGRCRIEFSYAGEGSVKAEITWSGSAFERRCWEMTADIYRDDIMIYENGHSWVETYTDDTTFTVSEETFDETGSFYMEDGKLHWVNDLTGENTVFIPA